MIGIPSGMLDAGVAQAVGVQYFQASQDCPPIRLFYPAQEAAATKPARWFEDGSVPFLKGYGHMALARKDTSKFKWLVKPIAYALSWLLPLSWLRIPGVYKDAPLSIPSRDTTTTLTTSSSPTKLPVIVFSHGLTGTGQENAALCVAWAKQGFVVAAIHHTDGSSCHVRLADGTEKYYEHGPSYSNYDPTFRTKQVEHRAKEMLQVCKFLSSSEDTTSTCPAEIRDNVDMQRVIAAGFSFGATTTAAAVVRNKSQFCAALFLDGWFHVDVLKTAGIEFNFPQEAFDQGVHIPSLFINSEQFAGYKKLYEATKRLADKNDMHVIEGTCHQNFCDTVFWLHTYLLRKLMPGAVGLVTDPAHAYQEIINLSSTFLRKVVQS
jgi:dienelactone hydrolase